MLSVCSSLGEGGFDDLVKAVSVEGRGVGEQGLPESTGSPSEHVL